MTLDELDRSLPNGFHDAKIHSIEIDYVKATVTLQVSFLEGTPEDPEDRRDRYRRAVVRITGLHFCSIDAPDPTYHFRPDQRPIVVSGDPAKSDHLPSLPGLMAQAPAGVSAYRLFVSDWNRFIYIAARDAEISFTEPV
jgi:hypothetical protein